MSEQGQQAVAGARYPDGEGWRDIPNQAAWRQVEFIDSERKADTRLVIIRDGDSWSLREACGGWSATEITNDPDLMSVVERMNEQLNELIRTGHRWTDGSGRGPVTWSEVAERLTWYEIVEWGSSALDRHDTLNDTLFA